MPRRRSLVTVIRDMVREQVQDAIQGLLGAVAGPKKRAKNGRRRRRGGEGRGDRRGRRLGCVGARTPSQVASEMALDQQHAAETYKSLITISVEVFKALVLLNGGAVVALLAYLGQAANKSQVAAHARAL